MAEDTSPGSLGGNGHKRRVVFDPTINLGHVLSFVGMMAAAASVYVSLRGELTAHEVKIKALAEAAQVEKDRLRDDVSIIRDDIREVRRGMDELRREARK